MRFDSAQILKALDKTAADYTFPMLDNGYLYLAAARLSLFRSVDDWGLVIEVFGYSPRAGLPDTSILTFASRPNDRNPRQHYVSEEAYENHLALNPHNEFRSVFPIEEGNWIDASDQELVASSGAVRLRNETVPLPAPVEYERAGIALETERPAVFEFCRLLAANYRNLVLATPVEQRVSIRPEMRRILQLDEWHHPDLVNDELPSLSETFRQLAEVLVNGDVTQYRPSQKPNTHWTHWPEGGRL